LQDPAVPKLPEPNYEYGELQIYPRALADAKYCVVEALLLGLMLEGADLLQQRYGPYSLREQSEMRLMNQSGSWIMSYATPYSPSKQFQPLQRAPE
jgi:hypothetical protein